MSDLGDVLGGVAQIISAVGGLSGLVVGVLALTRGSPREREKAAHYAIDRAFGEDDDEDEDDELREAKLELLDELRQRLEDGDES